jgi:hypothetical protein
VRDERIGVMRDRARGPHSVGQMKTQRRAQRSGFGSLGRGRIDGLPGLQGGPIAPGERLVTGLQRTGAPSRQADFPVFDRETLTCAMLSVGNPVNDNGRGLLVNLFSNGATLTPPHALAERGRRRI